MRGYRGDLATGEGWGLERELDQRTVEVEAGAGDGGGERRGKAQVQLDDGWVRKIWGGGGGVGWGG